jgi:hypothetical protein
MPSPLWLALTVVGLVQPVQSERTIHEALSAKTVPTTIMHFEMVKDGKVIGYQVSSLKTSTGGDKPSYHYRAQSVAKLPNGPRIEGLVVADLQHDFEPAMVSLDRKVTAPNGAKQQVLEQAFVEGGEIRLKRDDGRSQGPGERVVPKPREPFVVGMEFVVEAIDSLRPPIFQIHELDPQKGTVITYGLTRTKADDSRQVVTLQRPDGVIGYRFVLGADGHLESWAEEGASVIVKRCSEKRYDEVRSTVGD